MGAKWLADWCMTNSGDFGDVNSLAMTVASAVLGGHSGDELAAELFNLLGESFVESIQVHAANVFGCSTHQAEHTRCAVFSTACVGSTQAG